MQLIQKLSPAVANKIAAGEVVTEPVSVVKELIENSLDAGASEILIEIQAGGLKSIEVSDNGRGIYQADADLLFERHATSKLRDAKDLYRIDSLGFRGEALASIAAISKVTVQSRHRDEMQGFHQIQYGSNLLTHTRLAREIGTRVLVEDLFFNTPVREQFLAKSSQLERHVSDFVRAIALGHPEVRFRYLSDHQLIFVTHGDGSREGAIYDILGKELSQSLVPVQIVKDQYEIEGFISNLSFTKSNRNQQYFYVNGRWVDNPELKEALSRAYDGLLMLRRFPVALLWIRTDYSLVDVNVHPRKLEVRLSETLPLHSQLPEELRSFLRKKPQPVQMTTPSPKPVSQPIDYSQISLHELKSEQVREREEIQVELQEPSGELFELFIEGLRPIGQFDRSYLLFEKDHSLFLMDQHAAHEKVLYEAFMAAYEQSAFQSQILILPLTLDILPEQMNLVGEDFGQEFGYDIEVFGDKQLVIRAIPHLFSQEQAKHFLEELLDGQTSASSFHREALVSRSCKAAIKAHREMTPMETDALLKQLVTLQDPFTCPHGRPIFVEMKRQEVEKRFERI